MGGDWEALFDVDKRGRHRRSRGTHKDRVEVFVGREDMGPKVLWGSKCTSSWVAPGITTWRQYSTTTAQQHNSGDDHAQGCGGTSAGKHSTTRPRRGECS